MKVLKIAGYIIGVPLALVALLALMCIMTYQPCAKPDTKALCGLIGVCD